MPVMDDQQRTLALTVTGMSCGHCEAEVKKRLEEVIGVLDVRVDLSTARATVAYDADRVEPADLVDAVERAGYGAEVDAASGQGAS